MTNEFNRKSTIASIIVMICTLVSRLLGFIRTALIGAVFGAGGMADAINLVFNIPNNLRKLLAEGALSAAFIPEMSRQITNPIGKDADKSLVSGILGVQILILIPILIMTSLFPDQLVSFFENFADPAKKQLSSQLFRWMMPYLLLVSISAIMMAVYNTNNKFFIPAITPIVFSICVIISLVVGYNRWGPMAVAYGILAGGIMQILVQIPGFHRMGYRMTPSFGFQNPSVKRVLKNWVPILLTSSLFVINNQVAMLLASLLADKSTSAVSYAIFFYQLPFGVFSASITTVLYPRMSRHAAQSDTEGLIESLSYGYKNLLALLIPSGMLMVVMGEPIIAVAFQRYAFTRIDTILTARVLVAYAVGMPFVGLFNITQRALYAIGQTRKTFYYALMTVGLDIGLSLIFVFVFDGQSPSLAWANTISFTIGTLLLYNLIKRKIGFTIRGETIRAFLKVFFCCLIGLFVLLLSYKIFGMHWWYQGSSLMSLAILMLILFVCVAVIFLFYVLMKVEIVSLLIRRKP